MAWVCREWAELAYPEPLERLIRSLERLPGVGPRTAERLAFHILRSPRDEVAEFAVALRDARIHTHRCSSCRNVTVEDPCPICADESRDDSLLCVVAVPGDIERLEAAEAHNGRYHVLLGDFAPREGNSPDPDALLALRRRVEDGEVQEVVIATAPDREGEGAALLTEEALSGLEVRVTRLARGVPVGSSLEFLHAEVLAEAFRARRQSPQL